MDILVDMIIYTYKHTHTHTGTYTHTLEGAPHKQMGRIFVGQAAIREQ